jgi:hypothetical protein
VLMYINMGISHRGVLMAPDIHFIQKFFSMKSLAVKLGVEMEDIKNSTQEYIYPKVEYLYVGFLEDTGNVHE